MGSINAANNYLARYFFLLAQKLQVTLKTLTFAADY
jgi:hypothetical protein